MTIAAAAVALSGVLTQLVRQPNRSRLLVLDADQFKGDSVKLLRKVRQATPGTSAIIMTQQAIPGLDAIIDDRTRIIRKPFRSTALAELAEKLLAARRRAVLRA